MHPILLLGLLGGGVIAMNSGTRFLDEANQATKLALIGGGLYVSYKALKATGALK